KVAGAMLTHLGYEVGYARDGSEALSLYSQARESASPYDAVIMDLTIPGGMGGKELINKIRELDQDIKAIVSSGYSNDSIMANYQEFGFAAVITKPYSIRDLSTVLHEVLSGASRNR
ncbi:MAG: response regulator, partial [Nanoarchaeota archaeon]